MSCSRHKTLVFAFICGLAVSRTEAEYKADPDGIVFPGSVGRRTWKPSASGKSSLEGASELSRSLQLARKINSIDSLDEFLNIVQGVSKSDVSFSLSSRMGEETGERSNALRPVPAKCMPELQPVSLKQETDPSTIYFPSCTRVKRCGGCCSHSLLSCQPTATEIRNFEVFVVSVAESTDPNYSMKRIVPLEEHTKCECDCRIKAEHCTEKQSYVQEECRCACNNVDEAEKCIRNNDTKIWNPEVCTCICREELDCSTGFYFDQNTCRCRQVPLSRSWFTPTKGADYAFGQTQKPNVPPVIVPLDAADPRRKPKDDPVYK